MKIEKEFDKIAKEVFENYFILRDNKKYELFEIEIYLKNESKVINDFFRHDTDEHLNHNKLYWHYSGCDICLGNKKRNIYCGILIRGICSENKEVIYGSGKIAYDYKNKKSRRNIQIVNEKNNTNFSFSEKVINDNLKTTNLSNIIFKLPRVNLSNTIINKYFENKDLNTYLNLKVRYLRILNNKFYTPQNNAPKENREIWNILSKLDITKQSNQ